MSKSFTLETQTRYLWVILGRANSPLTEDFSFYYEKLRDFLDHNADIYGFIGHDKDKNDDGTPKFRHIHLLCVLKKRHKNDSGPRLSTSLGRLANCVGLPNQDIDIEVADDVGRCLRYCIHKGYPTKFQYDINELQTNLNEDEQKEYFEVDLKSITVSYLLTTIKLCSYSKIEVAKSLGLSLYMKYRNVIHDFIEEYREVILDNI